MNQEKQWLLTEKHNGLESEAFQVDCARLDAGEPLGYVIGHVPFLDCTIYLDSHPLIPRPETEYWTKHLIDTLQTSPPPQVRDSIPYLRVLDLCAGSGCSGVAIAKAFLSAHVDFAELDPLHFPTIKKNLEINLPTMTVNSHNEYKSSQQKSSSRPGLELDAVQQSKNRFGVYEADLFTLQNPSSRPGLELGRYDVIVSNPPYIDPALDRTETSVADYEPHEALYGGVDGMELLARIIAGARAQLAPGGQLWLEHEPEQSAAIQALGAQQHLAVTTHKDQYQVERYSVLVVE